MDETERHLFAHPAFTAALWSYDAPPADFEESDGAIIMRHNRDVHNVFAAGKKDFDILFRLYEKLRKEYNLRENKLVAMDEKIRRLSDKVRQQGEELKRRLV